MTEAIFGRRTRSQLILPDNILQIPDRSPLKDARTALRNQATTSDVYSPPKASDDIDDELLLSPCKIELSMKSATNSKRSASPPAQNEYSHGSSSPSDGRELKRAKRDTESIEMQGNSSRANGGEGLDFQGAMMKHTQTSSEPIIHMGRRSSRKRSATTTKKTLSTVSASPPPTIFSPPTTSPSKFRAQSVPVFPASYDIPRIDFRNLPPSPKRSRSRSPSKDTGSQLRIGSTKFPATSVLPTIQDEASSTMNLYEESNVAGNTETVTELTSADTSQIVNTATADELPVLPPTPLTSASKLLHLQIPATPAIESLNKLIPMSPLTPVPETPLPTRSMPSAGGVNLYTNTVGRKQSSLVPIEERAGSSQSRMLPPPPSELKSRLPRPSLGMNSRAERTIAQNTSTFASIPKGLNTTNLPSKGQETKTRTSSINAFSMLMNASRDASIRERLEKERVMTGKASKPQPPTQVPSIFGSSSKAETPVAGPSKTKQKMRQRMKPNTKPKPVQPLLYVGTSDDEEEASREENPFTANSFSGNEKEAPLIETRRQATPSSTSPLTPEIPMEVVEDSQDEEIVFEDKGVDNELTHPDKTEQDTVSALPQGEDPDVLMPSITANEILSESKVVPVQESQDQSESIQHKDISMASSTKDSIESPMGTNYTGTDGASTFQATPELPTSEFATVRPSKIEEGQLTAAKAEPLAKAQKPKLFLGKKKEPATTIAFGGRVTRSVSNQKNNSVTGASIPGPSHARSTIATAAKRTTSSAPKKTVKNIALTQDAPSEKKLLPGSPMKISSPAKAPTVKTPTKAVGRFTLPNKSISTPSPTKIARPSAVLSMKPSSAAIARTFSMDTSQVSMGASSSLSTLSNALEKLRMPAPSRPSTSMGFNRDVPDEEETTRSKDDAALGRTSIGMGLPEGGVRRATTLGADAFKPASTAKATASSTKGPEKNLVQKPISAFMLGRGGARKSGVSSRGTVKNSVMGKSIFGIGGAPRRLVSKKSALPTVIGSPVKGGGDADTTMRECEEEEEEDAKTQPDDSGDNFMAPTASDSTPSAHSLDNLIVNENSNKGKGKETEASTTSRSSNGSRRVSMASHALSQSLNAMPPPTARGLMGPPATPPNKTNRSSSSTYPSTSAGGSSPSAGPAVGTRASARIAKTAPGALMKIKGGTDGHVSSQRKGTTEPTPAVNPAVEALKVLKDCIIFVDVKTDDGDEAGSLFVEMLEGVGAKVLTRVGQTCTHIVFKNGLMSTITRYKLLRDPKPFVVGIAWVVECVEQRKHVDESEFLVDIEHTNVAGVSKRRRSILPRMFANEIEATSSEADKDEIEGDRSMDGSVSSITMDDELAPLERARRRKSLMPAGAKT